MDVEAFARARRRGNSLFLALVFTVAVKRFFSMLVHSGQTQGERFFNAGSNDSFLIIDSYVIVRTYVYHGHLKIGSL
jgi:hypothetical protein